MDKNFKPVEEIFSPNIMDLSVFHWDTGTDFQRRVTIDQSVRSDPPYKDGGERGQFHWDTALAQISFSKDGEQRGRSDPPY